MRAYRASKRVPSASSVPAPALELTLAVDLDQGGAHGVISRDGDDLLDAVVVTTGAHAYRRPGGIAVVPAALLTA